MRGSRADALAAAARGGWNQRIRRFNRAMLNPCMLRVADLLHRSYPAVVHHVGRRTGRAYRTPVVAQPVAGGFVISLPYGADTDWCRNVRDAGRFTIERAGQTHTVGRPEIVAATDVLPLVPARMRRAWRRFHVKDVLRVTTLDPDAAHRTAPGSGMRRRHGAGREEAIVDQEEAKRRAERVTGVSNVAYDLMVVLTNKLEGVAAMEEYKLDADAANDAEVRAAFERIEQRERQSIEELRGLLVAHLQRIQVP